MEEALYLTKFASEVTLVHRKDSFRASKVMQDKVFANSKIKIIFNSEVTDVLGENKVEGVVINNQGSIINHQCDGLFVAIGHTPATEIFKGQIELDVKGYAKRSKKPKESL